GGRGATRRRLRAGLGRGLRGRPGLRQRLRRRGRETARRGRRARRGLRRTGLRLGIRLRLALRVALPRRRAGSRIVAARRPVARGLAVAALGPSIAVRLLGRGILLVLTLAAGDRRGDEQRGRKTNRGDEFAGQGDLLEEGRCDSP